MLNLNVAKHAGYRKFSELAFLQVKAYGDFTIAASAISSLPENERLRCSLLIGRHLEDLAEAIKPQCNIEVLPSTERDVPAIFDLAKQGVWRGMASAISLREVIRSAASDTLLIMQRNGKRDHFIAQGLDKRFLPHASNIYLAYENFFKDYFGTRIEAMKTSPLSNEPSKKKIALFPLSRLERKNLPFEVIERAAAESRYFGYEPEIVLLAGESLPCPPANLVTRVIEKKFTSLLEALKDYKYIISADSLPAHMAEYCSIPVFVAVRSRNCFWLPLSSFRYRRWALFNDLCGPDTHRLRDFLMPVDE